MNALTKGNHSRYIEHPELLEQQEHNDGNAILEHVFGSKEVSSHTANRTAESTDLNDSLVKENAANCRNHGDGIFK